MNQSSFHTLRIANQIYQISHSAANLVYLSDADPHSVTPGVSTTLSVHMGRNGQVGMKTLPPDEPSIIYTRLPVSRPSDVAAVPPIGYFPSYANCSSEQRWIYLDWLKDISLPINISYAFIYYYGLERRLLTDQFDDAFNEILRLKQHHPNSSFQEYSSNALVHACFLADRPDRLPQTFFHSFHKEAENRNLLVAWALGCGLAPSVLIHIANYVPTINKRYIQREPQLYAQEFAKVLFHKFGTADLPMPKTSQLPGLEMKPALAFANISLPQSMRTAKIPDFLNYPPFVQEVIYLHIHTHEAVKAILQATRKR